MNSDIAAAKTESRRKTQPKAQVPCYHCGTPCLTSCTNIEDKAFCCEGCKLVYEILNSNGLCDYYRLQDHPGLSQIKSKRQDKWAYLDSPAIAEQLFTFTDGEVAIISLYLPGVHCSSCLWLLEHLPRVHPGIRHSRLQFDKKQLTIHFSLSAISLRAVVELLDTIGYEPLISLEDTVQQDKADGVPRGRLVRLGVAGFCFGNIMMLSFPEYFGGAHLGYEFTAFFRYIALVLSLPVVFFCAAEFFSTAWKGIRTKTLNIDAPIALAITITYARSLYEIIGSTGSGYLDSMSGIVFFMLIGRTVQERAWKSLSFHRDYKSYFPIAVQVLADGKVEARSLHDLTRGDVVQIHYNEIIPADAVLITGDALIDYSFVSGESEPVKISPKGRLYAGGRQMGAAITARIEQPVAGSYLTSLWNHHSFREGAGEVKDGFVQVLARYFTTVLFSMAIITAIYWAITDASRLIPVVSAMLIVACPCALLLSSTFTNGALLRALSNNGLYLRDAQVIEALAGIDHIVFDKTGTLTTGNSLQYTPGSPKMKPEEVGWVSAIVQQSNHPRSKALLDFIGRSAPCTVTDWKETAGAGVEGKVDDHLIRVGSAAFVHAIEGADVYVHVGGKMYSFIESPTLRKGVNSLIARLRSRFSCSLLSGDNRRHAGAMQQLFGGDTSLHFQQQPADKLDYIERLQNKYGHKVLMIGDGLNDAGALQQSNAGITLTDDINNFTPSCDAILDASQLEKLPALLSLARWGQIAIRLAFAISIVYNAIGLYYAVQGRLSPMIAAILMPASTLSIVLIGVGSTGIMARFLLRKT